MPEVDPFLSDPTNRRAIDYGLSLVLDNEDGPAAVADNELTQAILSRRIYVHMGGLLLPGQGKATAYLAAKRAIGMAEEITEIRGL